MSISVIVIAHNEEKYIGACIQSLFRQTSPPDEIVVVVHNSTDGTEEIARKHPVNVVPFHGPPGIVEARLKGIESVTGDIILCIDGDSFAEPNWVATMSEPLRNGRCILVGSKVKFRGPILCSISNIFTRYLWNVRGDFIAYLIWGPSFGFLGRDKEAVADTLIKSVALSHTLGLTRNPEDYWLAASMSTRGKLEITSRTWITANTKESSNWELLRRIFQNIRDGQVANAYFMRHRAAWNGLVVSL